MVNAIVSKDDPLTNPENIITKNMLITGKKIFVILIFGLSNLVNRNKTKAKGMII
jgi:hypothetical protein